MDQEKAGGIKTLVSEWSVLKGRSQDALIEKGLARLAECSRVGEQGRNGRHFDK